MPENYISKVKLPGDETTYDIRAYKTAGIYYAQVDSTSTSTSFTATIADLNIDAYYDGLTILLYNGKVTSASGFTININGLGAKPSYSNMALGNPTTPTDPTRDTTIFNINYAMLFVYNSTRVSGGCWICYRGYDANTNTIGYQLRTNNTTMPTTDKFYRYRLLFTSADHNHWVPANTSTSTNATAKRDTIQRPIDPFGEIVWYGTTTAIEANANVTAAQLWQQYYSTYTSIGYSFNRTGAAQTMTANLPIYIKCAPQSDGSAIIDADTPYVQALPNSEDGKIYIFLGRAYNATNFEILMNHPVYYYKDGAIRLWSNAAQAGPELFEVTINTTTYAQLTAAINDGQIPYAEGYLYDGFDGLNYNFIGPFGSNGYNRYSLDSTSGWTSAYCAFQAEGYDIIHWLTGSETWSTVYNSASVNGNLPIYADITSNVLLYLRNIDSSYTMHFVGEDASNYYEITLAYDDTWSSVTTTPKPSIPTATSDLTNDGDDGTHPFLATDDVVSTYSSSGTAPVNGTAVAAALATLPGGTVTNIATGSGLTGGPISSTGTISHADTSTQASVTNTGRQYIQSITLDDFGHITALTSAHLGSATLFALPVKQSSGSYILCPTSQAERWQFTTIEYINLETYVVSKWFTGTEIRTLGYEADLVIAEIQLSDDSQLIGAINYFTPIDCNNDGMPCSWAEIINPDTSWGPTVDATFANIEKNVKITCTLPYTGAQDQTAYGITSCIPTIINATLNQLLMLSLMLFLSESTDWISGAAFLPQLDSDYANKLETILQNHQGYLSLNTPTGDSIMIPFSTFVLNPKSVSGCGYIVYSYGDTIYEGFIKILFECNNEAWGLKVSSYVPKDTPLVVVNAEQNGGVWSFSPSLYVVWNSITDVMDSMAIKPEYSGSNIYLEYDSRIFLLTSWHDSGNSGGPDPEHPDSHTLVFTNIEDNYIRQFYCANVTDSTPSITYTETPIQGLSRSDFISVAASHVSSGASFNVYNSGGVVSQTSFSSSKGFTVAEGTVTAVLCYSDGGAVSQTTFGTASITPYTVTDVTAVNLT